MAKSKSTRRFSRYDAIALHAEANKSDPFAAKRIAMTIARDGYKEQQAIGEESQRLIEARAVATRKAYREWVKTPEGIAMSEFLRSMPTRKANYEARIAA